MKSIKLKMGDYISSIEELVSCMESIRDDMEENSEAVYDYDAKDWDSIFDGEARRYIIGIVLDAKVEDFESLEWDGEMEYKVRNKTFNYVDDLWKAILEDAIDILNDNTSRGWERIFDRLF